MDHTSDLSCIALYPANYNRRAVIKRGICCQTALRLANWNLWVRSVACSEDDPVFTLYVIV